MAEELGFQSYSVRQIFEVEETFNYYQSRLPYGIDEFGEVRFFNLKRSARILILGGTGAGKTWILRSLISRFYKADGDVVIAMDLAPEYHTLSQPLQPQFRKFLLPHEKPEGFPLKVYRPYFLTKLASMPQLPVETTLCQFTLEDLTVTDFYNLLGIDKPSTSQRNAIESAFNGVANSKITNLQGIKDDIQSNTDINPITANNLCALINSLETLGVIGDQFSGIDVVKDLKDKKIVDFDISGLEKNVGYGSTYVGLLTRNLLMAKKEGRISKDRHLFLAYDEVNKVCPNTGTTPAKDEILKGLDLFRKERGTMAFTTQDYKRVPQTILEQCNYIMFPHNITLSSAKEIIRQKASYEYDFPLNFGVDVGNRIGQMRIHRDGSRDWLMIDVDNKDNFIFQPLAPLAHHKLEGE
jgi:hypothetical protein